VATATAPDGTPPPPTTTAGWRKLRLLRGTSLWQRLALLFAIILLPPTVMSGVLAWESFSEHTKRAILSVRQFAVLSATYERRFFEDTRSRLQRLTSERAILDGDPIGCAELLRRTLEAYPEFTELFYFDPRGQQVCGTGSGIENVSGRHWFEDATRFRSFTISDYTFSTSSLQPVIVAALPVNDETGQLLGVLSSSIELTWLASFLRESRLPPDGVFFLLDSTGKVLASSSSFFGSANPALPKAESGDDAGSIADIGPRALSSVVRADLIDDVISRRLIDFEAIGKDNVRRVYSSVALPHGNVTLLFGVPADTTVGWIERDLVSRVLSLVAIWLAGIAAAWLGTRWLVTRWIAPLRRIAHDYGRGDYNAKLDLERAPRELREFGDTLMRMASRIEAREADLRDSLAQKDVLLREIHHRVKNNLQIVSSLLNIHGGSGPDAQPGLEDIKTRVRALALVHRYLYEGDDVRLVDLRSFLTELCSTLVRSLTAQSRRVRLEIDLPELAVLSDRAVPIALFVTEVMTNALKHAFPAGRAGRISVRFRFESETDCVLEVADDGVGGPAELPGTDPSAGLGSRLMEAFARQLGG
jgi:two-component sensor histidine kinase